MKTRCKRRTVDPAQHSPYAAVEVLVRLFIGSLPETSVVFILSLPPMRFTLSFLLYSISLVAACMGLLGLAGIPVVIFIASIWGPLFLAKRLREALTAIAALMLTWVLLCCLSMPTFSRAREAAQRTSCNIQLKQLTIALQSYNLNHQTLPPAMLVNDSGQPLHSWRALILPELDADKNLTSSYDFAEPWDSPKNQQLHKAPLPIGPCPTMAAERRLASGRTTYVAVVGDDTVLGRTTARQLNTNSPHLQQTIMLIEINAPGVPWWRPRDISFDEAVELLTSEEQLWQAPHREGGFFLERNPSRAVAMADGSIHHLSRLLSREQAIALLSTDQSFSDIATRAGNVKYRWNLGNCFRFAALLVIAFLPTPFAIRRYLRKTPVPSTAQSVSPSGDRNHSDANG